MSDALDDDDGDDEKQARKGPRSAAAVMAKAIFREQMKADQGDQGEPTPEKRKELNAELKLKWKEQKKSMLHIARRVVHRLDRAGFGIVAKAEASKPSDT